MNIKWFLFLSIFGISAISALAQARTVTNFDLEKYRTQRVQAETDLRENYAKLGFSSPEERAKRDEAQRKVDLALAERFERERILQEAADAAARGGNSYGSQQNYYQPEPVYGDYGDYGVYGGSLFYQNRDRNRFRGGFRQQQPSGYYAGGAFWPTPSGSTPPPRRNEPILRHRP